MIMTSGQAVSKRGELSQSSKTRLVEKIGVEIVNRINKSPSADGRRVFRLTVENFFAKLCNENGFVAYNRQKEKQSRKVQAELTAQPKLYVYRKEIDKNGRGKNLEGRNLER